MIIHLLFKILDFHTFLEVCNCLIPLAALVLGIIGFNKWKEEIHAKYFHDIKSQIIDHLSKIDYSMHEFNRKLGKIYGFTDKSSLFTDLSNIDDFISFNNNGIKKDYSSELIILLSNYYDLITLDADQAMGKLREITRTKIFWINPEEKKALINIENYFILVWNEMDKINTLMDPKNKNNSSKKASCFRKNKKLINEMIKPIVIYTNINDELILTLAKNMQNNIFKY